MKVTIKEVAQLANVSPSTVSRVISDSPRISDETKKKVRKTMEELGYHPNAIARSLVRKSTNTIGIVMPQSTEAAFLNPFFPEALSGISSAAHMENYCILLSTGNSEGEQIKSIENIVRSGRVDGVIIMYSSVDNLTLEAIKKLNIPSIVIGKPLNSKGTLYVDNDNVETAYQVTKELLDRGHKKIGFVSGSFKFVVSLDRLDGYRNALVDNNIKFDRDYLVEAEFSRESAREEMEKLLNLKEPPTAVIVTDDVMAFGVIDTIKKHGLRIPQDMEIISFNNISLSEYSNPSLTSVDINVYKLGYEAGKLIIEKIKGKEDKDRVIVPTKVIYRQSSINGLK